MENTNIKISFVMLEMILFCYLNSHEDLKKFKSNFQSFGSENEGFINNIFQLKLN